MLQFSKFLHTNTGRLIMSILLGFGLATLFRRVCTGNKCMQFKAPPMQDIEDKIYQIRGKCYKYVAEPTVCNSSKKIVHFE